MKTTRKLKLITDLTGEYVLGFKWFTWTEYQTEPNFGLVRAFYFPFENKLISSIWHMIYSITLESFITCHKL